MLWPSTPTGPAGQSAAAATSRVTVSLFGRAVRMDRETQLLLLAMAAGALGSYIHAAKSFADYAGNKRLVASWTWFYVLLPCAGVGLALVFYAVIRGGFLPTASD